jgi:hypothetical protein
VCPEFESTDDGLLKSLAIFSGCNKKGETRGIACKGIGRSNKSNDPEIEQTTSSGKSNQLAI